MAITISSATPETGVLLSLPPPVVETIRPSILHPRENNDDSEKNGQGRTVSFGPVFRCSRSCGSLEATFELDAAVDAADAEAWRRSASHYWHDQQARRETREEVRNIQRVS